MMPIFKFRKSLIILISQLAMICGYYAQGISCAGGCTGYASGCVWDTEKVAVGSPGSPVCSNGSQSGIYNDEYIRIYIQAGTTITFTVTSTTSCGSPCSALQLNIRTDAHGTIFNGTNWAADGSASGYSITFTPATTGWYRVGWKENGGWCSTCTNCRMTIAWTINTPPPCTILTSGGTIAGAQTVCYTEDPSAITSSVLPSGGFSCSGSITYQWQSRTWDCNTNNWSAWTDIAGATSPTYDPPLLTIFTGFRRGARRCSGPAMEVYSNEVFINVLNPNAARNAPLGPLCSGSELNFSSTPCGGNGAYTYSWTTTNNASTSSLSTFSPILYNLTCSNQVYNVTLTVTDGSGKSCSRSFTPTIRPVPSLNGNPDVSCSSATVELNNAFINSCAGCTDCIFTLTSCPDCVGAADPVGTSNSDGDFLLYGAGSAEFTVTSPPMYNGIGVMVNPGCTSVPASYDFLSAPFDCITPLSVELNSMQLECNAQNIRLHWSTATEHDNDVYRIERSDNDGGFSLVGVVDAIGNSTVESNYEFHDENPSRGVSYYRLSQTDFDGVETILGTLSTNWPCQDGSGELLLYPNPSDGDVQVVFSHDKRDEFVVETFNAIGQSVLSPITGVTQQTGSTLIRLNTNELPVGVYMVHMKVGEKEFIKKLIRSN